MTLRLVRASPSFTGPSDGVLADERSNLYPKQVWYGIALFLVIVGLFNWPLIIYSKFSRPRQDEDTEGLSSGRTTDTVSLRRLPIALANGFRVVAFRWTLDIGETLTLSAAEISLTVAYIVYIYVWLFIFTTNLEGEKLDWTYWSIRAPKLATSQFPLIAALGTKNSLISLITGVSFEKLSYLHRMMARVVFTLLWVHAGAEIVHNVPLYTVIPTWLACGMTAITAFSLLAIISLRPIRTIAYELFFYSHIVLVLVLLICAYIHTREFQYNIFIWPTFIIWGVDRAIRTLRLILFNHSYFGFFSGPSMDAIVEIQSEEYVRVRMRRPSYFHWLPGQTVYLIMPSVSRIPFEAHPFTIASFDSHMFASTSSEKPISDMPTREASVEQSLGSSAPFWKELVFFINVRQGFTSQLKKAAMGRTKVKAFVDGPYGLPPDLRSYDVSILIAGGTGISYILPTFLSIIEGVREGKSACRRVLLVWAVRDAGCINWVDETLCKALQLAPPSLTVSIRIHVTGQHEGGEVTLLSNVGRETAGVSGGDSHSALEDGTEKGNPVVSQPTKIERGRPDLTKLLYEEMEMGPRRLSVSVCASPGIARTVRSTLRFPVSCPIHVLRGGPSVSLFVESYGYA